MSLRQALGLLALVLFSLFAHAQPLTTDELPGDPLSREWMYFIESGQPLSPYDAKAAFEQGRFAPHGKKIPSLGIGAPPLWLALTLQNPSDDDVQLIFELANAWQDDVALYLFDQKDGIQRWYGGDLTDSPRGSRFMQQPLQLPKGNHLLLLRVAGPDPRLIPVYLTSPQEAQQRNHIELLSYGFLYGGLFALLGYNFILFLGIGRRSYFYYSLFLFSFILLNLSYTGHGQFWFWPGLSHWRQWSHPMLMTLYCVSGLMFALRFLGIDKLRPHLSYIVLGLAVVMMAAQGVAIATDDRELGLIFAFDFVYIFTLLMPLLGMLAWSHGLPTAKLFLLASLSTMVGSCTTGLAVEGYINFNQWTYRAAEIGMFIDAMLLALALAAQFRQSEQERVIAQQLAATDPLTGIANRRAFNEQLQQLWHLDSQRRCRALIMIDIDRFKSINDTLGHEVGDKVLTDIARVIRYSIRNRDQCGRWGGEEFVVLLSSASEEEAGTIAERIRHNIESLCFPAPANKLKVTASLGVCLDEGHSRHEDILRRADEAMYQAKEAGGNRVKLA